MSISVKWGDANHQHIVQTYTPGWTWQDFYSGCAATADMMRSVDGTVHIVSDFRGIRGLPMGSSFTHARNVMQSYPDNWGIIVIISDNLFIRGLVDAYRTLFSGGLGGKTYSAESLDRAQEIIEAQERQSKQFERSA